MFRTTATSVALAAMLALPIAAHAATAKQTMLGKVQPLANVWAAKHHMHMTTDRKTTSVSCSTFLGKTTCYASVVVMFEGDNDPNTMAVVGWGATLTRNHGKWLVRKLRISTATVIS